eukprot:CAMPEP_0178956244 /NCGR_PEP_ID=MMETSP0789-20121207/10116_1 /TAXON_ID=3005 /ORGANISM="Rhizosolenia setigera, Strain CCMP 1694" /LENGTH=303 /DNA_ID=CAMNT_0020638091 /DNA_START=271 /DNA_END=1182 /DNA_ORIENTATION=-
MTTSSSSDSDKSENTSTRKKMLGIITFDLDDTLFPIGPVVRDANDAMFSTLIEKYGFRDISEDQYLQACKTIRKELYNLPQEKKITYTELRKRAVSVIVQQSEFFSSGMDPQEISNEAFDVWLDERQSSANMNLFSEVIPAFDELQKKYPSVTIAAITNGRGNPLFMNSIKKYFDFCVSGEDPDVFPYRKPHPKIFEYALSGHYDKSMSETCTWVHLGDDLANDVGASFDCGAKTIWFDIENYESNLDNEENPTTNKSFFVSTASKEEQEARKRLAEKAMEKVDERIISLSEMCDAIDRILSS